MTRSKKSQRKVLDPSKVLFGIDFQARPRSYFGISSGKNGAREDNDFPQYFEVFRIPRRN